MSADLCQTSFGSFHLERLPVDRSGTLRAWDGADLLLLDFVAGLNLQSSARVAVVGDNFGALSIALQQFNPIMIVDSKVAERAIQSNRNRNGLDLRPSFFSSTLSASQLQAAVGAPVDVVVWNVDKVTDTVSHLAALLPAISHGHTVVFAAGMDKHLPPKTADVLRRHGVVTTHPGRRKAHLFELRPNPGSGFASVPIVQEPPVLVPEHQLVLHSGPGVFSADRFDLGTRLLAEQVADLREILPDAREVLDLGCGTGALGMLALRALPKAQVHFVDESARAVAAAKRNVEVNAATLGTNALSRSNFIQSDVLHHVDVPEMDLVLCNPPFHYGNAMNDEIAWQMFLQSHRALAPGGELWVVANRHLGYHDKLARLFEATAQMSSHPKFVVIAARR